MKRCIAAGILLVAGLFLIVNAIPADTAAPAKAKAAKNVALIDQAKCVKCGTCFKVCPAKAISKVEKDKKITYVIDPKKCVGCGTCIKKCPAKAISWAKPGAKKADTAAKTPKAAEKPAASSPE